MARTGLTYSVFVDWNYEIHRGNGHQDDHPTLKWQQLVMLLDIFVNCIKRGYTF